MGPLVIDTSVIMCVLLKEPGAEKAARLADGSSISSVSIAEVVRKSIARQFSEDLALRFIRDRDMSVINFDFDLAILAGQLRQKAAKGVLSLGDRACIATAIREGGTAVTADRIWSTLDLGCKIELIR